MQERSLGLSAEHKFPAVTLWGILETYRACESHAAPLRDLYVGAITL
jgi:hypothetical protein